jgi:hypothetical protein
MTFENSPDFPVSYNELGLTVTSLYPSGGHLHINNFDSSDSDMELMNHSRGSAPYEFTKTGGGVFSLFSADFIPTSSGNSGEWTNSNGGSMVINSTMAGSQVFNDSFQNVTWVRWDFEDSTTDEVFQVIDNLAFLI